MSFIIIIIITLNNARYLHLCHVNNVVTGGVLVRRRRCDDRRQRTCKLLSSGRLIRVHVAASRRQRVCSVQTHYRISTATTQLQLQPFNGLFSRTTWVSRYQKGKTNLDFTGARDSEWQWHQLGHMQVCTSLQTDNHASTPPLCFLQAGCPFCRPTNSVKALKAPQQQHKQAAKAMVARGRITVAL